MKILRPFTGTGAVFFPIGKPPVGTCEFATKGCMKYCYQMAPQHPNFDEEILIPEEEKKIIYEKIMNLSLDNLYKKIKEELDGLQTPILHWFGSGDCLLDDTDRVGKIVDYIRKDSEIIQMGFTRNKKLWGRHKDIFALTIEKKEDVGQLEGMFAIPNYKEETSVMYSPFYQVRGGYCGPITCDDLSDETLNHYINCKTCMRLKTGCFHRENIKTPLIN